MRGSDGARTTKVEPWFLGLILSGVNEFRSGE